ncbi:MAG: response regulator [Patescibacteria group bacterium]
MRVLILEEDSRIRDLLAHIATDDGHEVVVCSDSQAALELVDSEEPDALIISPNISRNSGLELLYEITSHPDLRNMPSILVVDRPLIYTDHQSTLVELGVVAVISRSDLSKQTLLHAIDHVSVGR